MKLTTAFLMCMEIVVAAMGVAGVIVQSRLENPSWLMIGASSTVVIIMGHTAWGNWELLRKD